MDNLKKSFLIHGNNVIGVGGQISKRVTQAEYDVIPDDEKNNNDVIYFITDGTDDEFGINDGIISEFSTWSSSKIESELKTSNNTDVVPITVFSNIPFLSKGDSYCFYKIVNGICYFQLFIDSKVDSTAYTAICDSLPRPLSSIYFGIPTFYNVNGVYKTLQVNISTDGVMMVNNSTNNASYMLTGSYPVA